MFRARTFLSTCLLIVAAAPSAAHAQVEPPAPAPEAAPADAAEAPAPAPEAAAAAPAPVLVVDPQAEARAARRAGDHATAARALEASFARSCDPRVLREIGAELEAAGDLHGALAYYGRFMAEGRKASSDARRQTGRKIAELHGRLRGRPAPAGPRKTVACGEAVALEGKYTQPVAPPSEASAGPGTPGAPLVADAAETPSPYAGRIVEVQVFPAEDWAALLHVGRSFGDVSIGAGIDVLGRTETTTTDGVESSDTSTALLVTPGLRVSIERSEDGRVECFGSLDLGVGTIFGLDGPPGTELSALLVSWRVGPGLRYWLHPRLAIGALFGISGEHVRLTASSGGEEVTKSESEVKTFAAFHLVGRF